MDQLTEILAAARAGDPAASGHLVDLVYNELRQLALSKMRHEAPGHTLQATALVHEAWLRLGGAAQPPWANRAHFFSAASEAMRRILVEHARRKRTSRRGGDKSPTEMAEIQLSDEIPDGRILQVSEVLERFALLDPLKAELVKLRYFIGLTIPEAASVLGISEPTAKRYWAYARAWLLREMQQS